MKSNTSKGTGTNSNQDRLNHRPDAEWLTFDICDEYRRKAEALGYTNDIDRRRELRLALQNRCDITEVEAVNILKGYHTSEYVRKYELMSGKVKAGDAMTDKEYQILQLMAALEQKEEEANMENEGI